MLLWDGLKCKWILGVKSSVNEIEKLKQVLTEFNSCIDHRSIKVVFCD